MVKLSLRCTKTGSGQFIGDMPAYYQTIRNYERRREKKKEIIITTFIKRTETLIAYKVACLFKKLILRQFSATAS